LVSTVSSRGFQFLSEGRAEARAPKAEPKRRSGSGTPVVRGAAEGRGTREWDERQSSCGARAPVAERWWSGTGLHLRAPEVGG
jgi:hypothetical protein